jgi:hypothetical protein
MLRFETPHGARPVIAQDCAVFRAMAVASASVAHSITMPRLRVGPSPVPSLPT